jgi:LasA protease
MGILHKRVKFHVNNSLTGIVLLVSAMVFSACSPAATATATVEPPTVVPATPSATFYVTPTGYEEYLAQSGDTLAVIAAHFGVDPGQVVSQEPIPTEGLIDPGQKLLLPAFAGITTPNEILIPDSEVVFSSTAAEFDAIQYVDATDGKLKTFTDLRTYGTTSGIKIIIQWALEFSINPRLLLSLLELNGKWITDKLQTRDQAVYAYGYVNPNEGGLYQQTGWAVSRLINGYYGWRSGTLTELTFPDGSKLRLAPNLNAGTVAVMFYLSQIHNQPEWKQSLNRLVEIHTSLFGDFRARSATVEPLFPAGLKQPELLLPFPSEETWNYTCGPHTSWGKVGQPPLGALDFAPPADRTGCGVSSHFAAAMASGLIIHRKFQPAGLVIEDLDMDNNEQTGWVLYYMHIAGTDRVQPGTVVQTGELIGHPSCEGGSSSGIHEHVARKYNGEWVPAEGGLPFVLSGYLPAIGQKFCEGTLTRDSVVVNAYPWGNYLTKICQPDSQKCKMGTPTPIPTPTLRPTSTPRSTLTPRPTPTPTATPTPKPTLTPSLTPTVKK